jgi:hypothetical protein
MIRCVPVPGKHFLAETRILIQLELTIYNVEESRPPASAIMSDIEARKTGCRVQLSAILREGQSVKVCFPIISFQHPFQVQTL